MTDHIVIVYNRPPRTKENLGIPLSQGDNVIRRVTVRNICAVCLEMPQQTLNQISTLNQRCVVNINKPTLIQC